MLRCFAFIQLFTLLLTVCDTRLDPPHGVPHILCPAPQTRMRTENARRIPPQWKARLGLRGGSDVSEMIQESIDEEQVFISFLLKSCTMFDLH